ncbi:MAG: DUF3854 domain-containing protein [Bdellovibrionaceae bacterium]|nr:DUF3854 domain-containing protein [Pseudobdellovibrionaceae bacterium]
MSKNKISPNYFKEELRASLITPEWVNKSAIYELPDSSRKEIAELLNRDFTKTPHGPYLVFEYYDPFEREKLLTVNVKSKEPFMVEGKEQKYLRPSGSSNHLYIPKFITVLDLLNIKNPILFTEGEKKTICANINGFLTIGLNGVQNWKTKGDDGTSKPLDVFEKLNLDGRQVLICFDSDVLTNENVLNAENEFANYLQSLGAKVRVLRFPESSGESKVGIDDYILKHGVEEFKKLAKLACLPINTSIGDIETYLNDLKDLSTEEVENKIKTASYAIAGKGAVVVERFVDKIKDATGTPKDVLRDIFGDIKKQTRLKKTKGPQFKVIIYDSETMPTGRLLKGITEKLVEDGRFYREGNELIMVDKGRREFLNVKNFPASFNELSELKIDGRFRLMPPDIAQGILYSPTVKHDVKEIGLFTSTITYDDNWNLVKVGYNPGSKILYCPPEKFKDIKPRNTTSAIQELLQDFCFKNEASRVNAIGALLTALFRHKFQGSKAFFANTGNQPGLGKSLLAQVISIIVTGEESPDIDYIANEYEMGNRIASTIQVTDILNFDNIKSNKELSSGPLERSITSPRPSFRKLGVSELIEKPNTFVVFISINDAMFGKDLLTRMCPIEFWFKTDPRLRDFTKSDLKKWALDNRKVLIEELVGMVERWKSAGCPLAKVKSRFSEWPLYIGGILEANGFKGFMDNFAGAQISYTQEAKEVGELFTEHTNKWMKVTELVNICREQNCFRDILAKSSPNVSLGIKLNKLVESKTQLPLPDGTTFILKKSELTDSAERKVIYMAETQNTLTEKGTK